MPTGKGLTFEKVWAMFQETDLQIRETDRIVKENALQMKENERILTEKLKETEKIVERNALQLERLGKQMGDLHRTFGEMAEHMVAPGIARRFDELGRHFDSVKTDDNDICDEEGRILTQVDILLENSEYIVAVEVKTRPRTQDIHHHIKRLKILREYADKNHDSRKIQGAMAGAIYGEYEKQATIEAGLYVIKQSGDTMKIAVPDGFIPREWQYSVPDSKIPQNF
jgi:hypothetical protein